MAARAPPNGLNALANAALNGIQNFAHAYITAQAPTRIEFEDLKDQLEGTHSQLEGTHSQLEGTHSQLKRLADSIEILARFITTKDEIAAIVEASKHELTAIIEAKTKHLATKDDIAAIVEAKTSHLATASQVADETENIREDLDNLDAHINEVASNERVRALNMARSRYNLPMLPMKDINGHLVRIRWVSDLSDGIDQWARRFEIDILSEGQGRPDFEYMMASPRRQAEVQREFVGRHIGAYI